MSTTALTPAVVSSLNDLFTRFYIGAATYVFESDPYEVAGDAPVLDRLREVRAEDGSHAKLLANLLRMHDVVPEPGVFPYWHRDLNYLTVPYMANFVVESLEEDLRRIDQAASETPDELRTVHATLRTIRKERAARLEALRPIAEEAQERERQLYRAAIDAVRGTREARVAREKEAEAAARQAAQDAKKAKATKEAAQTGGAVDVASLPDPNEEGISSKEKAKRTMLIKRAQKAAAAAPAPAAPADPTAGLPDPNEEGISSKEKAKRTMLRRRAAKAASAQDAEKAKAAKEASPSDGAPDIASMPDPNEPGISPKERAKRTMMIKRAQKKAEEAGA